MLLQALYVLIFTILLWDKWHCPSSSLCFAERRLRLRGVQWSRPLSWWCADSHHWASQCHMIPAYNRNAATFLQEGFPLLSLHLHSLSSMSLCFHLGPGILPPHCPHLTKLTWPESYSVARAHPLFSLERLLQTYPTWPLSSQFCPHRVPCN